MPKEKKRLNKFHFYHFAFVAIIAIIVALVALFKGYPAFGISFGAAALVGIISIFFTGREVYAMVYGKYSFFVILSFVFRLACIGFFVYIMLVELKLSPAGIAGGFTLSAFSLLLAGFVGERNSRGM